MSFVFSRFSQLADTYNP